MSVLNTSKTFQARDIWVGDSHSAFISAERLAPAGAPTADFSGISFWIGPQLAYSFRSDLLGHLESTLIRRAGLQQAIFVMGEIDVRFISASTQRSDAQTGLRNILIRPRRRPENSDAHGQFSSERSRRSQSPNMTTASTLSGARLKVESRQRLGCRTRLK